MKRYVKEILALVTVFCKTTRPRYSDLGREVLSNEPYRRTPNFTLAEAKSLVKAETMVLDGDPKEMICEAVEQTHADLLVVGSRGFEHFWELLVTTVLTMQNALSL
ncbi:hypothetical protein AMTR_s00003p00264130 [Amborella trichopoda]|uniref:UspA domain-containing protein n=1 Tax=Amborella trichopoda TaxID=13333 RepID=W1P8W9_AMBTC|nr:hypothetical protein AMTR_s00003p00264130 [Amborella trichopoda]